MCGEIAGAHERYNVQHRRSGSPLHRRHHNGSFNGRVVRRPVESDVQGFLRRGNRVSVRVSEISLLIQTGRSFEDQTLSRSLAFKPNPF